MEMDTRGCGDSGGIGAAVPAEKGTGRVSSPLLGVKGSLNVSVAFGIPSDFSGIFRLVVVDKPGAID